MHRYGDGDRVQLGHIKSFAEQERARDNATCGFTERLDFVRHAVRCARMQRVDVHVACFPVLKQGRVV